MCTDIEWMKRFAKNLQFIMDIRGYSQRDVARMTGLSESNISKYLNLQQMPKMATVTRMAKSLYCSVADLIE